jgi:hypothetical protein
MINLRAKTDAADRPRFRTWRVELLFALPIVAWVTYLFYTWFAVRDRYFIFLYFHDMGAGFDTTPFGRVTASRYWMSGLVAAGAVWVAVALVAVGVTRLRRRLRAR